MAKLQSLIDQAVAKIFLTNPNPAQVVKDTVENYVDWSQMDNFSVIAQGNASKAALTDTLNGLLAKQVARTYYFLTNNSLLVYSEMNDEQREKAFALFANSQEPHGDWCKITADNPLIQKIIDFLDEYLPIYITLSVINKGEQLLQVDSLDLSELLRMNKHVTQDDVSWFIKVIKMIARRSTDSDIVLLGSELYYDERKTLAESLQIAINQVAQRLLLRTHFEGLADSYAFSRDVTAMYSLTSFYLVE